MESSQPRPSRPSPTIGDGRVGARPSPARPPSVPSDRRERIYRGIVLTGPDLVRIAEAMRAVAGAVELSAEGFRFAEVEDLVDFALEEMSIAHLEMSARAGDESLRLSYAADRVALSTSAAGPEFRGAFWRAASVLDACRPSGTTVCDIAPGEPQALGMLAALKRAVSRRAGTP
jgi:hypothetical protein